MALSLSAALEIFHERYEVARGQLAGGTDQRERERLGNIDIGLYGWLWRYSIALDTGDTAEQLECKNAIRDILADEDLTLDISTFPFLSTATNPTQSLTGQNLTGGTPNSIDTGAANKPYNIEVFDSSGNRITNEIQISRRLNTTWFIDIYTVNTRNGCEINYMIL